MKHNLLLCLLALTLVAMVIVPAAASPTAAAPCAPGLACDANQNGVIDVFDIQLTAGHWNQNGTFTSGSWDLTGNAGTSPGIHANSGGTYAGYFLDQIFVTGGGTGCTLLYVVQNAGDVALQLGVLVAATGVADALAGTADPVLRVGRRSRAWSVWSSAGHR